MDNELERQSEKLAQACRDGKTGAAYRILQSQDCRFVQAVALKAGFACISIENRRDFMSHLISQVAEACRRRTDGYGLRKQLAQEARARN